MFLGQHERTIDDKGRLTVPAKYRAELVEGLVVTRGIDRCLAIYPLPKWNELSGRVNALPITDRRARAFRRLVFAAAHDDSPDDQGRILIPPRLREYAGLDGGVIVTGLSDHMEVWDPQRWHQERDHVEADRLTDEDWASLGI
jgi:MraZ protein